MRLSMRKKRTYVARVASHMLAAVLAMSAVGCGNAEWPTHVDLPEEFDFPPWLTMPEPNRIVVSWRAVEPSTGTVRFGTSTAYDQSVSSSKEGRLHHVDLGRLEPATQYYYEVEIDGTGARRAGTFQTPGASNWRFVHIGEFHAPSMSRFVARSAEAIRAFQPHVIVESGDMVDSGSKLDDWRSYFRTSAPWISNAIFLPIGSNHVRGSNGNRYLRELFILPNNERWYPTRWGNVQFLTMDSTYDKDVNGIDTDQLDWLAEQTAFAHDGVDDPAFLVATWHYPACSSSYDSRDDDRDWVMENFVRTFVDNGGLDMALVGHDKYYERSIIEIDDEEGDEHRIVHVQSNVGKIKPGSEGKNRKECTPVVTNTDTRSLTMFTVEPSRISGQVVDDEGEEIDSFVVERR